MFLKLTLARSRRENPHVWVNFANVVSMVRDLEHTTIYYGVSAGDQESFHEQNDGVEETPETILERLQNER